MGISLSRIANAVLLPLGWRMVPSWNHGPTYYQPPADCQIPELSALYSMFLGERTDGYFVEVGAYDGISFSNTSCLAARGWSGILVEPIPQFADACRTRYASNPRIKVVETAIGDSDGSVDLMVAEFLTTTNNALLETYRGLEHSKRIVAGAPAIRVRQTTLDVLLERHVAARAIDVLVVDTEGAEDAVFRGFSLERWRPRMLIVELAHTHPQLRAVSAGDADLQRRIEQAGYAVVYKDLINTVFVASHQSGYT